MTIASSRKSRKRAITTSLHHPLTCVEWPTLTAHLLLLHLSGPCPFPYPCLACPYQACLVACQVAASSGAYQVAALGSLAACLLQGAVACLLWAASEWLQDRQHPALVQQGLQVQSSGVQLACHVLPPGLGLAQASSLISSGPMEVEPLP